MQNYTYCDKISKTPLKSAFLGLFLQFYSTLYPFLEQKAFSPSLQQKSESPLPAGPFSTPPPPPAHYLAQAWVL